MSKSAYPLIDDDRWVAMLEAKAKTIEPDTPNAAVLALIEGMSIPDQKTALAYASQNRSKYLPVDSIEKNWKKVDGIYETIIKEFPSITVNHQDALQAVMLGYIIKEESKKLSRHWEKASATQKINSLKDIFAKAYANDNIDHMQIKPNTIKASATAFVANLDVDTMLCGPLITESKKWEFPLFLMTHELQYRRQAMLVQSLKDGKLTKGSEEYYQARLFKSNLESAGYLSPTHCKTKVGILAKTVDYLDQPVEAHANYHASLAAKVGETGGDMIWGMQDSVMRVLCVAAKPLDKVMSTAQKALSLLKPQ